MNKRKRPDKEILLEVRFREFLHTGRFDKANTAINMYRFLRSKKLLKLDELDKFLNGSK